MEKITKFTPAFDKRNPNPSKDYGIHGANMLMLLKGELGVVQFLVYTNWHLPHVQEELLNKPNQDSLDIKCRFIPLPADVGYHSPKPIYEGQTSMSESCEYLNGGKCYYDGSGIHAEEVFKMLISQGSDKVWEYLEEYYMETFGELK